jgi:hypothetical protein
MMEEASGLNEYEYVSFEEIATVHSTINTECTHAEFMEEHPEAAENLFPVIAEAESVEVETITDDEEDCGEVDPTEAVWDVIIDKTYFEPQKGGGNGQGSSDDSGDGDSDGSADSDNEDIDLDPDGLDPAEGGKNSTAGDREVKAVDSERINVETKNRNWFL